MDMLIALVVSAALLQPAATQTSIPATLAKLLSANYLGWRLAEIPREPGDSELGVSNVLRGDYDGDGSLDYAVLLNYENAGSRSSRSTRVVALLQRTTGPQLVPVSRVLDFRLDDDLILRPARKGSSGYDLNTDVEFVYERDGIILQPASAGPCASFINRNGKFDSIWTCD